MQTTSFKRARADAIAGVRAYLKQPGIRKRAVAQAARIHYNTLHGVESDDWNPSNATLIALEKAMAEQPVNMEADT